MIDTDTTVASVTHAPSTHHNMLAENEWLPVTGWPLKELGTIAEATAFPSLLLFANRARTHWRQTIYLALALGAFDQPEQFLRRVGYSELDASTTCPLQVMVRALPVLPPTRIITGCFEQVPQGLIAALRKLECDPVLPETYRLLARWHQDQPREFARCNLLQKMVTLNQGRIDALETLDSALLIPAVLNFTYSQADAERLNNVLGVIRGLCTEADFDTLRTSARELQGTSTVRNWAEKWFRRADKLPPPPFVGDDECRPLIGASEVEDAARRFKNCLSNRHMASVLSGKVAVVEYVPEPTLALLANLSGGHWLLVSVHGAGNRPVPPETEARVQAKVLSFGSHIHKLEQPDKQVMDVLDYCFGGFEPFDLEWQAVER